MKDTISLKKDLSEYLNQALQGDSKDIVPEAMTGEDFTATLLNAICTPWMLYFLRHDPTPILERVDCAVLALNGEKDLQVTPKENLSAIQAALEKGGTKIVLLKNFQI